MVEYSRYMLSPSQKRFALKQRAAILSIGLCQLILALLALLPSQSQAQSPSTESHTEAAVIADDVAWGNAENSGNVAYVDALLLPEYRSISPDGSIHDKTAILQHTRKSTTSADSAAKVEKWKATHPYVIAVKIVGDTAVLTFSLDKQDSPKPIMSCDIFVYRDGHWRALYSQHTEAEM
jgi:Domain of unknown function (DUF4440)